MNEKTCSESVSPTQPQPQTTDNHAVAVSLRDEIASRMGVDSSVRAMGDGCSVLRLGDTDVVVRRLTVPEIRAWFREIATRPATEPLDLVDELLFEEMSLREMRLLLDISPLVLETATPADLAPIVSEFIQLNPEWLALRRRLAELGKTLTVESDSVTGRG